MLSYLLGEYIASRPRREILRDRSNLLNWYGDEEFQERFRFTKPNFLFILRTLQDSISPQRNQDIPAINKLLITFLQLTITRSQMVTWHKLVNLQLVVWPLVSNNFILQNGGKNVISYHKKLIRPGSIVFYYYCVSCACFKSNFVLRKHALLVFWLAYLISKTLYIKNICSVNFFFDFLCHFQDFF